MEINKLVDLNNFRTAPKLSDWQAKNLLEELEANILNADWITIGVMAPNDNEAKANQKTGNVFVRSENGLGEGILITCQYDEGAKESNTFGPLPLYFFI